MRNGEFMEDWPPFGYPPSPRFQLFGHALCPEVSYLERGYLVDWFSTTNYSVCGVLP